MKLSYELRSGPDHPCLVLHGELDLAVRDQLHAILQRAIGLSQTVTEVDLHDVTHLDCACIGVLMLADHTARRRGHAILLTHPRGDVRRVLEVADVLPYLSASSSEQRPQLSPRPQLARLSPGEPGQRQVRPDEGLGLAVTAEVD
jgi:anti-anti-sigma factor